jgi:hypothetical protein
LFGNIGAQYDEDEITPSSLLHCAARRITVTAEILDRITDPEEALAMPVEKAIILEKLL